MGGGGCWVVQSREGANERSVTDGEAVNNDVRTYNEYVRVRTTTDVPVAAARPVVARNTLDALWRIHARPRHQVAAVAIRRAGKRRVWRERLREAWACRISRVVCCCRSDRHENRDLRKAHGNAIYEARHVFEALVRTWFRYLVVFLLCCFATNSRQCGGKQREEDQTCNYVLQEAVHFVHHHCTFFGVRGETQNLWVLYPARYRGRFGFVRCDLR